MKKLFTLILAAVTSIGLWADEPTEIYKVVLSGDKGATQTITGTIGGTCAVNSLNNNSAPYKLNSDGAYVAITLAEGNYFDAKDIVTIDGADKAHQIYYGTPSSGTLLITTSAPTSSKITFKLKGLPANQNTIYVYRASSTYNGKLTSIAVSRPAPLPETGSGSLSYTLTKGSAVVSGNTTLSTLDPISDEFTRNTLAIGSNNSMDGYCGQITNHAVDYAANTNVALQFKVSDGYEFVPSNVNVIVYVNSSSNMKSKVVLSDGETTIESNEVACSSSADTEITFADNAFTNKSLKGTVDVKFYTWGATGKRTYIKSPIVISGSVAATITKYDVVFAAGDGTGTMGTLKYAEGAEVTLPECSFTAPEGKEFDAWTSKDVVIANGTFTMPAKAVTITATWKDHVAHTDATLSDLKVNGTTIVNFDAATLEYNVELGVYETIIVTATPADSYATAEVVDNGEGIITITVTAEDKSTKEYAINYSNKAPTELATISAATTWDFTKTGSSEIRLTDSSNPQKTDEFNYADLLTNPDASFNAAALAGVQEYVVRDNKFAQGTSLTFKTSVVGNVVVTYANTGDRTKESDRRWLAINGEKYDDGTLSATAAASSAIRVAAGTVVISGIDASDKGTYLRYHKVVFTPIPMYAVSFAANGGTGEMEAEQYAEGDIVTLPECSFTAPDGKEFDAWTSEDVTISNNKFTMPAEAVTITASWKNHATHSDATLKALSVAGCTLAPAFDAATLAYTTTLPFYASMPVVGDVTATKNDEYAQEPVVSIEGNVISILVEAENGDKKTYTVTVTITETPEASTSINIEQNVLDNSKKWGVAEVLAAANITVGGTNGLDSLNDDPSKPNRNYAFLGLKFNKAQDIIKIIVPAEKVLNVKFGNIATAINVTVNGVAQTPIATKTDGYSTEWNLAASNAVREVIFSLGEASKTVTLQQVMIGEGIKAIVLPWRIQFDSDGGSDVADVIVLNGEAANQPADPTKTGLYFAGWYNGENKYDWESEVTSNLTLKAHWSENPTALVNTSDAEKAQKRIENGQLVIEKNGKVFNAMGQTIR